VASPGETSRLGGSDTIPSPQPCPTRGEGAKAIGIVAIGRNEGERLKRCLESAKARAAKGVGTIVYVDSGSTDGSAAAAREMGAAVVELDLSIPFTAARARNEGFAKLLAFDPSVELVQFVDGDCEIVAGWIERAANELRKHPDAAVVCGRRRERFPDASVYNKLCDIEWNTPVGEAKACGGDAMMRVSAFQQVGGFNASCICGEEPELCVRLRAAGWKVLRVDAEMTLHDAAMTRFGQFWKRQVRGGWAYAEGAAMHGNPPERHNVKQRRSVWLWGLILPIVAIALAWPTRALSLLLLPLGYAVLAAKIYRYRRGRGDTPRDARRYAAFVAIGKVPEALGQLRYYRTRLSGRRATLIEYKTAPPADVARAT
jgi:GT2 family glycosyltransferase